MSNRFHALAQQLTGKASIEECSLDEVQQLAQRYPYFAPAQFLYLQKLKQTASPELEVQQQKAVLFYNDPLQFEYFISSNKFNTGDKGMEEQSSDILSSGEEFITASNNDEFVTTSAIETPEVTFPLVGEVEPIEKVSISNTDEEASSIEEAVEIDAENSGLADDVPPVGNASSDVQAEDEQVQENQETPFEDFKPISFAASEKTSSISEEVLFEPFHTVDYFASQGIKISQEELPKDKLGKQLKSFTQWLKTMKRLPPMPTAESTETLADPKVESMATDSVTESNVVTEAMAEVWAKQGNRQKATEIYNKLSLLNPSKTAYFAAKIQNLKSI